MYTPLYDDKHRFHVLSSDSQPHRYGQKGFREHLLCQDCETQLSRHERYVSHVLNGKVPVQSQRTGNLVKISGFEYTPFKLFALSILWRASVSRLPLFSKVDLGPHEEKIRIQLLREDPGPSDRYGVFLSPLVENEIHDQRGLIVQPTRSRLGNSFCYRFVFGGLIWVFVVSSHPPPKEFRGAFVNEQGKMLMLVTEVTDVPFIMRGLKAMYEAQHGAA